MVREDLELVRRLAKGGGEISSAAIRRLIRRSGAPRIGSDAATELRKVVEELAISIGKESMEMAKHAGRKTITADDIRLVSKRHQF
ncbi:MAG TPA: histone family protein [Candidatus Binatus sp.]|nr:histone family protein [Candidatus Binatus sp.]